MKILTFTTLYPNHRMPGHGIFVENRLRRIVQTGRVQAVVVAPVPWFPLGGRIFGRYGALRHVPREEERHGMRVFHPRYPVVPKVGMLLAPFLLARAMLPRLKRLIESDGDVDLIDAHYFYPDGVAAVSLGRALKKPVVVTARGSDVNVIPRYRIPRGLIVRAARRANAVITVSRALRDSLVALGAFETRIEVLRNGVDLELFRPPRETEGGAEGRPQPRRLLSVGNLVPLKGHDLAIRALRELPEATLSIVGDGPSRRALEDLARRERVGDRVEFLGRVEHHRLAEHYGRARALVLASESEGWANVLLESMACGTPVVATRTGGNPEVVAAPEAGVLAEERTPSGIARAVESLLARPPARGETRRYAERFSWDETVRRQIALYDGVLRSSR